MPLTNLRIINFQAHTKLKIDLDPLVTTIVGATDAGKSSVVRALRWLAFNKPSGVDFVKQGTEASKVVLQIDGREIRRAKGKGLNAYHIDGKRLVSFGADVPEEVKNLLGLDESNFQGQHDAPYWFSETSGEVSRRLNQIINLGAIDSVLVYLNSLLRQTDAKITVCEERLAGLREKKSGLLGVTSIDVELRELERTDRLLTQNRLVRTRIDEAVRDAKTHTAQAQDMGNRAAAGEKAVGVGTKWLETASRVKRLGYLIGRAQTHRRDAAHKIPLEAVDPLDVLHDRRAAAGLKVLNLRQLVQRARQQIVVQKEIAVAVKQHEGVFSEKIGHECPLCGSVL